jgi:hypothetical protein
LGGEIWDVIENEHVVYVNRHDHRARNLRHRRRVPLGKHSNSSFKYASSPAKTNTQADSQADSTVAALKGKYFGNANLSALFKTQTDPTVNFHWGDGNATNTNASLELDTTPTRISTA